MGLSQALSIAMSGLRATQASISLVGSNVANAETPGYVRKTAIQVAGTNGDYGSSVLLNGVDRQLDQYLQTQLRTETSGAAYADIRATFLANLQNVYGNPAETGTIEDSFNKLLTAFQGLSTSPDSQSARIGAVAAAQTMAQTLNATTQGIQNLRANAEMGINDSIVTANNAMAQIAFINNQLQNNGKTDAATASLLDQRDQYITQLSALVDIRTVVNDLNQVTVFTNSGVQLVGTEAAQLSFNPQGTITPNTLYNPTDPTKSNVGTITINFPHGGSYDLVSTNSIRSGKIAAYLELRDNTLVKAQAQVDQFAAAMSSALSDKTTAGTAAPASVLPQAGYDLDLTGLQSGNVIHVTYKDNTTGVTHNLSIVRVDDPSVLPLSNTATLDPNDEVLGINFSGGMGSVISQLNAALGTSANLQFSNPSGSTLRVLDDGAPNRSDVLAASVTTTISSLTSGNAQLPLFTDNGGLYYRCDHRQRFAADRPCRAHQRQSRTARRSLARHCVLHQPVDGCWRHHALRLRPYATADGQLSLLAANRHWHHGRAVHRHADQFCQAVHQPAGRSGDRSQATRRRPGRGAEHLAEKSDGRLGRQYRRRNGASARAAECLLRQRARDVVHQADVRHADQRHMRVSCLSTALTAGLPTSGPRSLT